MRLFKVSEEGSSRANCSSDLVRCSLQTHSPGPLLGWEAALGQLLEGCKLRAESLTAAQLWDPPTNGRVHPAWPGVPGALPPKEPSQHGTWGLVVKEFRKHIWSLKDRQFFLTLDMCDLF